MLSLTLLCGCGTPKEAEPEVTEATEAESVSVEVEQPEVKEESGAFGLSYFPTYGLNPFTCLSVSNRAMLSLLYEPLFVVSDQFRAEPVLCDTFTVSEDGETYVFTLVPGVRFSDGTAMTVQDVAASITAARSSPLYSGRLSNVEYVVAQEDGALLVELDTAYENFPLMLDIPIVKETTLDAPIPTGTGPYVHAGRFLRKNYQWWQTEPPVMNADSIPLTIVSASNELRDNFEFGDTDLIYCDPNSPAASSYRCDYEVWEIPTTIMHYIGFNTEYGYFSNDALRQVVTYAIDRETLANTCYAGFAKGTPLPCSPFSDLHDEKLAKEYDYAPGKFNAAVSEAKLATSEEFVGYTGTFLVCADDPTRITAAESILKVLTDAGFQLTLKVATRQDYETALEKGNFDLYYGEVRLPANFDLYEFFSGYGDLQYGFIADAGLATLCTESLRHSGVYSDLCRQLLQAAPICPVVFKSYAAYVTRGMLTDNDPAMDHVFRNAETARSLADADRTYAE